MRKAIHLAMASLSLLAGPLAAQAASSFTVEPVAIIDQKSVFATVESLNEVPARVRTGGTIASLLVREGDAVTGGQIIATIGDQKLVLQQSSLDAQIAGLQAQLAQARSDLDRAKNLYASGVTTRARLDQLTTEANVAATALRARTAERGILAQQLTEGEVLAPTAGRVLHVPVTVGTVVESGETVAMIAAQNFVLRLRVPERHARMLKAGDPVRLDGEELGQGGAATGTITLVYPQIEDGRVVADARVAGLGDYFVGERVRVWIAGGTRTTFLVPAGFIETRFGLDYVRLRQADGGAIDIPVQAGNAAPQPGMPDAVEILSGLQAGDVLVQP